LIGFVFEFTVSALHPKFGIHVITHASCQHLFQIHFHMIFCIFAHSSFDVFLALMMLICLIFKVFPYFLISFVMIKPTRLICIFKFQVQWESSFQWLSYASHAADLRLVFIKLVLLIDVNELVRYATRSFHYHFLRFTKTSGRGAES
jgi:hypothetical protein